MNKMLNHLKEQNSFILTENGAVARNTTMNGLMDLFALGGSYRTRSEADCILLFKKALDEDIAYAMKCLFYLRDVRGGQGERRFFRVVAKWLANNHTDIMRRNLQHIPMVGRWDDLYVFVNTPLEKEAFKIMYHQLALDVSCKTPSLLAKWLKSENTSSNESRLLAIKTREHFGMTPKQYRKTLSTLRARIRVLERLMSENKWDEIEFDKIPSKAGMIYRNAFARHDLARVESEKNVQTYEEFAKDTTKKVNAKTLAPYEVVAQAGKVARTSLDDTERLMVNKYWDNLANYFDGATFDGVAVVDTSGSMTWVKVGGSAYPIDVATAMGMYCAEKCNPKSPWYGHYISFSSEARLIPVQGVDFVDKANRIRNAGLCQNTNIESVFNLLLNLAIRYNMKQSEIPKNIIILSDMEFDAARGTYRWNSSWRSAETLFEGIKRKWHAHGYVMPHLVFWNLQARQDNIPMKDDGNVTYVSGFSPSIFEQIMSGKTGLDLILEKLNSERYAPIK